MNHARRQSRNRLGGHHPIPPPSNPTFLGDTALTLGIPEQQVRVIAPSVGGGFGSKLNVCGRTVVHGFGSKTQSSGSGSKNVVK